MSNDTPGSKKKIIQLPNSKEYYDAKTGAVEKGQFVWVPHKYRNDFKEFGMVNLINTQEVAKMGLPGRSLQTFLYMVGELEYDNWVLVSQKKICEELKMSRSQVSGAISSLIKKQLLEKDVKNGRKCYRFSPELVWRGKAKDHTQARIEYKARMKKLSLTVVDGEKSSTKPVVDEKNQMDIADTIK